MLMNYEVNPLLMVHESTLSMGLVKYPDPPSTLQEERGSGEYSTFLYCHEFQHHYLIGWFGNYLTCTGLPYHKPLTCTQHVVNDRTNWIAHQYLIFSIECRKLSPKLNFKVQS